MGLEIRRLVALSSMYCVDRWRWMQKLKKCRREKEKRAVKKAVRRSGLFLPGQ